MSFFTRRCRLGASPQFTTHRAPPKPVLARPVVRYDRRLHSDFAHRDDPVMEEDEAKRVTWISVNANASLIIAKLVGGVAGNSAALLSDAVHSMTDLVASGMTLWAIKAAREPKDEEHPYGHGRFETIGAVGVAAILVLTGVGIAWHSIDKLFDPQLQSPQAIALAVAALSVGVQEWTYRITMKAAEGLNSEVLRANAWHHRTDALSSVVAFGGIGAAQLGMPILDPLAGIAVAALVVKAGVDSGWRSVRELSDDTRGERELIKDITKILTTVEGVEGHRDLRSRRLGPYSLVDVRIEVPPRITVSAGHEIAERARAAVMAAHADVQDVLVHVDPAGAHDKQDEYSPPSRPTAVLEREVKELVEEREDVLAVTHIATHYDRKGAQLTIEVDVDPSITVQEAHQVAMNVRTEVIASVNDVNDVDVHLETDDGGPPRA